MKSKKTLVSPVQKADDVLETSEVVRASNILLRMSVGILGFANDICAAEVFSESKREEIQKAIDVVFESLQTCYASLMGRYSALKSSEIGKENAPKS